MKAAAAVLALTFGLLQPVSITECPCGFLCGHKNVFETGKDAVLDDCCSRVGEGAGLHRPEPAAGECFHLEPQTELTGFDRDLESVPESEGEIVPIPAAVAPAESADRPFESGLSPPARGRPLYLRHSRFLI